MLKAHFFNSANRCCCAKGVSSDGQGGYVTNPSVRVGRNDKCPIHRAPLIVEEDEFPVFGQPLPPSAPC